MQLHFRSALVLPICALIVSGVATGCSDDSDPSESSADALSDVGADSADVPGQDAAETDAALDSGEDASAVPTFSDGTWPVRMSFQDFGGVEGRFEWTFVGVTAEGIARVEFQGVAADGTRSDVLVAVEDVPIIDDTFTLEFEPFFLPGAYSPTGSDLDLNATVVAQIVAGDFVCGDVSGLISTFDLPFSRTTFGAVSPDAPEAANPPLSCDRTTGGGAVRRVETIGSDDRPASLELPADAQEGEIRPVVVVLHGRSATGQLQTDYFALRAVQDDLGFLLVIPEGNTASDGGQFWNATAECCDSDDTGVDDVGYLVSLIEEVQEDWDGGEVYLIGHSNGGFMSHRFVCDEPDLVSGIVALAGSSFNDAADCGFDGALSVLLVHGTADETVPYEGFNLPTYSYPGARELVERWTTRMACAEEPAEVAQRDYETSIEGDDTEAEHWTGCEDDNAVALWTINGGIHIPALDSQVFTRDALTFVGLQAF